MSYIIGIGGGSGAGKSTLAIRLKEIYGDDMTVIQYDNYCCDRSYLTMEERQKINYDVPSSYDGALFSEHLRLLKQNQSIERPIFDFASHSRLKETVTIAPSKIIVLDGIMVYQVKEALDSIDYKIFVDAKEELRLDRRIKRDIVERGRTKESVITQFTSTVAPMHKIYVEPTKNICDFVLDNNNNDGLDENQVKKIVDYINNNI